MVKKVAKRASASKKPSDSPDQPRDDEWELSDAERAEHARRDRARAERLTLLEAINPTQWLIEGGGDGVDVERRWAVRGRVLGDVARVLRAFPEDFAQIAQLIEDVVEAEANDNDAKLEAVYKLVGLTRWQLLSYRRLLLPQQIDPKDYKAIRRALELADGEPDHESRAYAYTCISIGLSLNTKTPRFSRSVKDAAADLATEFEGARYADSHPSGAANRQRKGLRVLLEHLHGYSLDESAAVAKAVFEAPAKRERRSNERVRSAKKKSARAARTE